MVAQILDPLTLGIQRRGFGWNDATGQRLTEHGSAHDLVHGADARREDLGVNSVAEIRGIDLGSWICWVGRGDMYGTAGEGVLETYEEGDPVLTCGRFAEEDGLVVAGAHVELAGDAEDLDVGEGRVAELGDDELVARWLYVSESLGR